jgi:hypothetical protein
VQGPGKKAKRYANHLAVFCPTTHGSIRTKIATDVRTLAKSWHSKIKVSCPHCGKVHTYRVCEAFMEGAISNARLRGDLMIDTNPNPVRPHA